ncbi:MAG: hypothetical protein ED555_02965 [Allomuricauda sp.]|nr:MAG: hypothetical protein ED555_02965 [Allomuricauda sp.]
MIKFFRKIRQKLLSENKLSKYLLYAIGEIVLVVIGILIALQINTWNERQKNTAKESVLLKQINSDFRSNKIQLDSIKIAHLKAIEGCDVLLGIMPFKEDKSVIDTIVKYAPQIFGIKTFNPSNGSVDALISSSTFDLIQNDSLRNLLVSWKDVYLDYYEEEQYARNLQIWEIQPFFMDNVDYSNLYSASNLQLLSTPKMNNIWPNKRGSIQEILNSIKDERLELYIDEIIRLTEGHD